MSEEIIDSDYGLDPEHRVEYAGFWIRVGAALIDVIIFIPLIGLEIYNKLSLYSVPLLLTGTMLMIIYKPYLEYTRGQTVGKMAVGIKVVNQEYQNITLNQSIIRYLPWLVSALISLMISLEYYRLDEYPDSFLEISLATQDSFWTSFNGLYSIAFFVIVVIVAFDKRKQGLHDKIAETYCIKVSNH